MGARPGGLLPGCSPRGGPTRRSSLLLTLSSLGAWGWGLLPWLPIGGGTRHSSFLLTFSSLGPRPGGLLPWAVVQPQRGANQTLLSSLHPQLPLLWRLALLPSRFLRHHSGLELGVGACCQALADTEEPRLLFPYTTSSHPPSPRTFPPISPETATDPCLGLEVCGREGAGRAGVVPFCCSHPTAHRQLPDTFVFFTGTRCGLYCSSQCCGAPAAPPCVQVAQQQ